MSVAAVLTAAGLGVGVMPAVSASAAGSPIKLIRVQYDSPGSDTGSNTSLNGEWARIKNTGSRNVSLKGWTLRDKTGYVYTLGTFTIKAGGTVTVHTGRGTNSAGHRYWGKGSYVWNNTGDTATLRNISGTTVDTCTWKSGPGYINC